jgi:hypothetical protein
VCVCVCVSYLTLKVEAKKLHGQGQVARPIE